MRKSAANLISPSSPSSQAHVSIASEKQTKLIPFGGIWAFIASWRSLPPYELASYPLMFASVPMLAAGMQQYNATLIKTILFTVISLYGGFFAALIWNDITDADIDSVAHPDRPIPSGRISRKKFFAIAVLFSVITVIFAYLISVWCLALTISAALYVAIHNVFLKRSVPIPAYSEISTPIQWVVVGLFGYVAVWSALPGGGDMAITLPRLGTLLVSPADFWKMILLVSFIYFTDSCHDIPEGIVDADGDRIAGVRTYATSFGERNATRVALVWFVLAGLLGIVLFAVTSLSCLFLCSFILLSTYTGSYFLRLVRMTDIAEIRAFCPTVGRKGFNHFLFVFDLMFLDLLLQRIISHVTT